MANTSPANFLKAELKQAKDAAAYYTLRVQTIEQLLQDAAAAKVPQSKPSGRKQATVQSESKRAGAAKKAVAAKKGGRTASKKTSAAASELPHTGGDYWYDFVNANQQSAVDIANAAIASLGFTPTPEQIKTLKSRATPMLNVLVKNKRIKEVGTGRERRFFRA